MTSSPDAMLQSLVDQSADEILFGGPTIELPTALCSLILDVMAVTAITDPQPVVQRVLGEFHTRLDLRLRSMCDDVSGARWRWLLRETQARFPTCH